MLDDIVKKKIADAKPIFDKEFKELFEIILALDDPAVLLEKISYIALTKKQDITTPEGMYGDRGIYLAYSTYEKVLEYATSGEYLKIAYPR
jgi:hypothetical protein